MKWVPLPVAIGCLVAATACSGSSPQPDRSGLSLLIELSDSHRATRDLVVSQCGYLPAVTKIVFIPRQSSTLRFEVQDTVSDQGLITDVQACLHGLPQVRKVLMPL